MNAPVTGQAAPMVPPALPRMGSTSYFPASTCKGSELPLNACIVAHQHILNNELHRFSDMELLALVLGRGTPVPTATQAAQAIAAHLDNNLHRLWRMNMRGLLTLPGMQPAAARNLVLAMEWARRRRDEPVVRPLVKSSADAYELLRNVLRDLPHEEFWLLLLDRGCRVIKKHRLSVGGVHGTVADPKTIFKTALDHLSSMVVVAHNHPSGQLQPSEEDMRLTRKLVEGGRLLDILISDHLIITDGGYYSFADNGAMH